MGCKRLVSGQVSIPNAGGAAVVLTLPERSSKLVIYQPTGSTETLRARVSAVGSTAVTSPLEDTAAGGAWALGGPDDGCLSTIEITAEITNGPVVCGYHYWISESG